jgi:hypothetical protein
MRTCVQAPVPYVYMHIYVYILYMWNNVDTWYKNALVNLVVITNFCIILRILALISTVINQFVIWKINLKMCNLISPTSKLQAISPANTVKVGSLPVYRLIGGHGGHLVHWWASVIRHLATLRVILSPYISFTPLNFFTFAIQNTG